MTAYSETLTDPPVARNTARSFGMVREDRSSKTPKSRGLGISWALRRPAYSSYADCAEPAFAPEVANSFHQSAPAIISRICRVRLDDLNKVVVVLAGEMNLAV
jgi:hypothetical protein